MNANYNRTGSKRWAGKLNVQNVDGVIAQLRAERYGDADQWRVRKSGPNCEVRPAVAEPFDSLIPGHVESVSIDRINLGERFDQIRRITLIAAKAGTN